MFILEKLIMSITGARMQGKFASRSEAIRLALRDYYREHFSNRQSTDFSFPTVEHAYRNIIYKED